MRLLTTVAALGVAVALAGWAEARQITEAGIAAVRACVWRTAAWEPTQGEVEFDTVDADGQPVDHIARSITGLLTDDERAQARGLLALALARLHADLAIPTPTASPTPTPTPTPTPIPTPTPVPTPTPTETPTE